MSYVCQVPSQVGCRVGVRVGVSVGDGFGGVVVVIAIVGVREGLAVGTGVLLAVMVGGVVGVGVAHRSMYLSTSVLAVLRLVWTPTAQAFAPGSAATP